jgi:hypothetical protein
MARLPFFLLFFCPMGGFYSVSAQKTPEILQSQQLQKGIYKTYSEFLRNSPSIRGNFQVTTRSSVSKIGHGDATYRLTLPDSAIGLRDARKFWGVCDGKDVFVNELPFTTRFTFRKMQGLGRYCFLMASEPSSPGIVSVAGPAALVGTAVVGATGGISLGEMYYLLNINNGKFYPLAPKTLETILSKDRLLLVEYQRTKKNHREEVMVEFIKKYNSSHLHEADADLWFGRDVTLYRGGKREIEEPLIVVINDTLQLSMGINEIHRIQVDGESIELCVNGDCKELNLYRKDTTYILVEWKRVGANPSFINVEPQYAKDEIGKINRPDK